MNPFDPTALIRALNSHPEVFICGPSRGSTHEKPETHLRVYANGGVLCKIPTTHEAEILIPSFKNYLTPEVREALEEDDEVNFTHIKGKSREAIKRRNEKKSAFLMKETWLRLLLKATEDKFSKSKPSGRSGSSKERRNQTAIARNHRDFQAHKRTFTTCGQPTPREYLTVVCDFEMTIPQSWYRRGASILEFQNRTSKRPKCDLVTFSCTRKISDPWFISIIELKCNREACHNKKKGSKSNLEAHARDMTICMTETKSSPNQTDYILEILRRLSYMLRYHLLENVPEGLETEVNRLLPKSWNSPEQIQQCREKIRNRVDLRSCFLFTGDDDIQDSQNAAALCRKAEYLRDHLEGFSYQFREDPSAVDLSDMESWITFSVPDPR